MITIFLLGMLFGIGAALAPGPINIEILRRAMTRGPKFGLAFGLGAVTADMSYLTLIMFGLTAFLTQVSDLGRAMLLIGGASLLLIIGIREILEKPPKDEPKQPITDAELQAANEDAPPIPTKLTRNYFLGFLMTAIAPTTPAFWTIVSLNVQQATDSGPEALVPFVAGVFTVVITWLVSMVTLAGVFHKRFSGRLIANINHGIGYLLVVLAVFLLGKGIIELRRWQTAPQAVSAQMVSLDSIIVRWQNQPRAANKIVITRSQKDVPYRDIATLPANATSYVDTGLTSNTMYFYTVKAVTPENKEYFSSEAYALTKSTNSNGNKGEKD